MGLANTASNAPGFGDYDNFPIWGPGDPRLDDDRPDPDACLEQAADELERTPDTLAFWLSKAIDAHQRPGEGEPFSLFFASDKLLHGEPCTVAELLIVLLHGCERAQALARHHMLQTLRACPEWQSWVMGRAAEIEAQAAADMGCENNAVISKPTWSAA